jgi:uncharacterized membrane protein YfcA
MKKEIPQEINKFYAKWDRLATLLRILFIFLVMVSIVGSLVVSTFADQLSSLWIRICSFSAALSMIVMTSMDIAGKANRVRNAVRHLNAARVRYESEADFTIEKLISAYVAGEKLIGDVNYVPQDTHDSTPRDS